MPRKKPKPETVELCHSLDQAHDILGAWREKVLGMKEQIESSVVPCALGAVLCQAVQYLTYACGEFQRGQDLIRRGQGKRVTRKRPRGGA